jgi:hypothetical protein
MPRLLNCANAQLSVRSNDGSLEESVTVEDLEAALEQFREIVTDLGGEGVKSKKERLSCPAGCKIGPE